MTDLSRRAVLLGTAGGAALLAVGCSTDSIPIIGGKQPDEDLRLVTAASELQLIAAYDAAMQARPGLVKQLGRFKAQHEQHLAVLIDGLERPNAATDEPIDGAIGSVRRLESSAARQRAQACAAA